MPPKVNTFAQQLKFSEALSKFDFAPFLEMFCSSKPLPDDLEITPVMREALCVLHPLVFDRVPDFIDVKLNLKLNPLEWRNLLANWMVENNFTHIAVEPLPSTKMRWAIAIYSYPSTDLIQLMRPMLATKSYKQNLSEREFLKKCCSKLDSFIGLRRYLTEYSDFIVLDHPEVFELLEQQTPEDLPRKFNFSEDDKLQHYFNLARWFVSGHEFYDIIKPKNISELNEFLAGAFFKDHHLQLAYQLIFYAIEYLLKPHSNEYAITEKRADCVEFLRIASKHEISVAWILSKLYEYKIISRNGNASQEFMAYFKKNTKILLINSDAEFEQAFPLVNYYLSGATGTEISLKKETIYFADKADSRRAGSIFILWFESHILFNFKKFGIAESDIAKAYPDLAENRDNYAAPLRILNIGTNDGLFYNPLNQPCVENQLDPEVSLIDAETLVLAMQGIGKGLTIKAVKHSKQIIDLKTFPVAAKEELLKRNSEYNIPVPAFASLMSLNDRYQVASYFPNKEDIYRQMIEKILRTRSYLSNVDHRNLLQNCGNKLENINLVIPMLTSYLDYIALDHCNVWLHLSSRIPKDMQDFLGENAYDLDGFNLLMYAKWWTAKKGVLTDSKKHLDQLMTLIKKVDNRPHYLQIKMELLCYVVRLLLAENKVDNHKRDGCKELLKVFAQQYNALNWLLMKMYESQLLVGTSIIKKQATYVSDYKDKLKPIWFYGQFDQFFPLLNNLLSKKPHQAITKKFENLSQEDYGVRFLAWLESTILFNPKQFGINEQVAMVGYPNLHDAEWRTRNENQFADGLRLGRSDGLFYSLPEINQIANIGLEMLDASAPQASAFPSRVVSAASSRISSPIEKAVSEDEVRKLLQQAVQSLSNYADVPAAIEHSIASAPQHNSNDDDNVVEKSEPMKPDDTVDKAEVVVEAKKSVEVEDPEIVQLSKLPVEFEQPVSFPEPPTNEPKPADSEPTRIALVDSSHLPTPTKRKSPETIKVISSEPVAPIATPNHSPTFFAPNPDELESINKALAKEAANLAAVTQVSGYAEVTTALMQKIIEKINQLFERKMQLEKSPSGVSEAVLKNN